MKMQLTAACIGVAALCGCQLSTAPDPAAGLGPKARVHAPVLEEVIGELHLDRDGLWVFSTDQESRAKSFATGQIVAFGDLDETSRHLFAVVEVRPWGLRLQRLDSDAVELNTEGSLIPLSRPDLQTGRRWNFCAGEGAFDASECLQRARPGSRWHVYPLGADGRAEMTNPTGHSPTKPRPAMPVPLVALVAVGSLGTDVHQEPISGPWIAVPGDVQPRPTVPRIVVDQACQHLIGEPGELDAQWLVRPGPFGDHPVEVTSAAFAEGADAFVGCDGEDVVLSTPGLYRRTIEVPGQGVSAPPFLAAKSITLRKPDGAHARAAARLAAAISTGDFTTADFYADRLARLSTDASTDTLLLLSMAAIAQGGRPEAAVLLGLRAGSREWNMESSGPWIWGMATAQRELGAAKEAIVRAQSLSEALDRGGDDLLRGWITYFWALEQLRKRESVGDTLKELEAHPLLAFAARAEFARRAAPENIDGLAAELESRELSGLAVAFGGGDIDLPCPTEDCALDVYGRLWAGGRVDANAASRTGYSSLRPGFREEAVDADEPMAGLVRTLALYPFLEPAEQLDAVEAAARASTRWVAESCFPQDETTREALDRLRRLGIDAALRMEDWQTEPNDATMAWLAIRGVPAACESVEALVARATELAEASGPSTVPAELLTLWVERASGDELREVLTVAAQHVSQYERGQRCVDWNLALAVDNIRTGRFEEARRFVEATSTCEADDRFEIDLVAAYLGFQRSGAVSADFGRTIRERLAVVVHSSPDAPGACLGAGQLDYHLLPQISPPIADLVRRMPAAEVEEDEAFGIVTAADRLESAREALTAVTQRLDAGQPIEAARELGFARERFEGLGHEVGLARVRWIDEQLFGGKAAEAATGDAAALKGVVKVPGRKQQTFSQYGADLSAPTRIRLAYAASTGDEPLIRSLVETAGADAVPTFCDTPDVAPPGTVLDLSPNGQLERVSPPADQPRADQPTDTSDPR